MYDTQQCMDIYAVFCFNSNPGHIYNGVLQSPSTYLIKPYKLSSI